jgi:hypothetical protein
LDQFSPRQSRPHFKIASIAAAGASQSKDRNDKQKTGFFDSIGAFETSGHVRSRDAIGGIADIQEAAGSLYEYTGKTE